MKKPRLRNIHPLKRLAVLKFGSSLVEEDKIELDMALMRKAKEKGVFLLISTYVIIAYKFIADANRKVCFLALES